MGIETQEPNAQDAATSFSLHSIAETKEPATHSVAITKELATAETQELAADFVLETQEPDAQGAATSFSLHSVAETQDPATHSVAVTQELAIAITQEPTAAETQELDAQGAATLFSLHQVESYADFVVAPQEPATEVVAVTQKLVITLNTPMTDQQPKPTMASVLQDNEFLRSELDAYKQELLMVKEAYDMELNFYTLARTMAMAEKNTKDDQYREYMCSQCGDIYDQAGYKVVQIPSLSCSITHPKGFLPNKTLP